jgi:hypothetical protein
MVTGVVSKSLWDLLHTPPLTPAEMLAMPTHSVFHTPITLADTASSFVP